MAQHFQSGSPYGAPYPAGSYYPTYQQLPPQQPLSTSPFVQQTTRPNAGYHASPNHNMGRFEANSQAPVPTQNFPFAPSPFTPDIFKQFSNASIPPPPPPHFPPVPIPHLGFPQFAQNFPQADQVLHQPTQSEETTSDTSDAYDPRFPQQPFYSTRTGPNIHIRKENQIDGQRKEGDATSSRTMSQEDHTQVSFESSSKGTYPSNFDGSILSSQSRPKNLASMELQSGYVPNGTTLTHSSTEQMLALTPQKQAPVTQPRPSSRSGEMVPDQRPVMRSYKDKTPSDLRQLAKGALLSLAPHSIHYPDLVREGLNENVLQQLYGELGVKIEAQEITELSQPDNGPAELVPSAPNQRGLPSTKPTAGDLVPQVIAPAAEAPPPGPRPAVSPSLERKDRIAQLLAARTGRPSPVRSCSESGASIDAPAVPANDENASNTAKPDEVLAPQPEAPPENILQAGASTQSTDVLNVEPLTNTNLEPKSTDGIRSPPTSFQAGSALQISTQASFEGGGPLSSIPGLFMTSTDPRRTDNSFSSNLWSHPEPMDARRSSHKRSFEPDVQQVDPEPKPKRRNTDTTDAMEIDQSMGEDEASEGEVNDQEEEEALADGRNTTAPASATVESSAVAPLLPSPNTMSENVKSHANQAKTRLTSAQIAEKAEMLKARFLKQRAERQRALQDGLPGLDAEVQKTSFSLTQLHSHLLEVRLHIKKLEGELLKARTQEVSLLEEIAQLTKQLREGVTGQKQYTDELKKLSSGQNTPQQGVEAPRTEGGKPTPPTGTPASCAPILSVDSQRESDAVGPLPIDGEVEARKDTKVSVLSTNGHGVTESLVHATADDGHPKQDGTNDRDSGLEHYMEGVSTANGQINGSVAADEVGETHLTAAVVDEDDRLAYEETMPEYEDDEEFRDGSEGSASMSDSGVESDEDEEEEYEPDAAPLSHPMDIAESDEGEYDPEDTRVLDTLSRTQRVAKTPSVEDDAQPAQGTPRPQTPSSQMSEEMVHSPPAELGNIADDEYIPPDALPEAPAEEGEIGEAPPQLIENTARVSPVQPQPDLEHPDLRLTTQMTQQEPLTNSANGTSTIYHPYQSPLSSFQSFRYNEQFSKAPPQTGFRSLTYSNNINPSVPLCPTEISEGVCEDANCEEQHFRHLGLSDDKILVSLSSANGMEEPLRKEYLLSLKRVIADLRKNGVKEFEGVANALSEHRRSFFNQKLGR